MVTNWGIWQMPWVWLILLAVGIYIFYHTVRLLLYGLAYLGVGIVMGFDFIAHGLTRVGVSDPVIGWLILGLLLGGTAGLARGFKRSGRMRDSPKADGGAVIL